MSSKKCYLLVYTQYLRLHSNWFKQLRFPRVLQTGINLRINWRGLICFKFYLRLRQKLAFLRQPGDVPLVPILQPRFLSSGFYGWDFLKDCEWSERYTHSELEYSSTNVYR